MNPYEVQPSRAFWKSAVAGRDPLRMDELWTPKFAISKTDPIAALGSCFAQHISRALVAEGYNWINAEPAPRNFSPVDKDKYQYEIFSVRTSNIYTVALLRQWMSWAFQDTPMPDEIWRDGDRVYDPFRPTIEPNGFCSAEEMFAVRRQTLDAIRQMFEQCRVFIFTLGLTEAWVSRTNGHVYPMCPGTAAGAYNVDEHKFKDYDMFEIHADLRYVLQLLRLVNPEVQVLLTVSPVPLTATASDDHVLTATIKSKSILRAVAASIVGIFDHVDYFPSYEIISSFPYRGIFFEPNMRTVTVEGVAHVMNTFFRALEGKAKGPPIVTDTLDVKKPEVESKNEFDIVCEEMMLQSYAP